MSKLKRETKETRIVADVRIGAVTRYGAVTQNGTEEAAQGLVLGLRGANARAVVVTIPDPRTSTRIVESVRTLNGKVSIIARARYHMFVDELENAGATIAVDEEYLTGHRLREAMSALLLPGVEDR